MQHEEFVKKISNNEIKVYVDKTIAMLVMDDKNQIAKLMPKNIRMAHKFWMYFFTTLFFATIIGFMLAFIIDIGAWYWYLVGFLGTTMAFDSVRTSAVEFIIQESIKNPVYYYALLDYEKIFNTKILQIIE